MSAYLAGAGSHSQESFRSCNRTTTNSSFPLDTTRTQPDNPHNFSASVCPGGIVLGVTCSTFPAGLFSASIRNAKRAATGSVWAPEGRNIAATAGRRCITCPHRSDRGFGCARARWGRTVRCAGRIDSLSEALARREQARAANGSLAVPVARRSRATGIVPLRSLTHSFELPCRANTAGHR